MGIVLDVGKNGIFDVGIEVVVINDIRELFGVRASFKAEFSKHCVKS